MDEHTIPKPPDDASALKSFEDYSCGLYKDRLLIPGRLYIAKSQVTFQPQFGQSPVTINTTDITGLFKKNTAYVFPNAIEIATKSQKYFLGSFYFRDQAFATLQSLLPSQLREGGDHETNDDDDPGVPFSSLPQNLFDQAKIYLNPSPSNHSSSSSSSHSQPHNPSHPSHPPSSTSTSTTSASEIRERENDTPSKRRSRAHSANSDDEELKPLSEELKPLAAKGLAALKRMTKSASERSVFDRSNTPPPATSFSPPPIHSYSANTSPSASPIPVRRDELSNIDLESDRAKTPHQLSHDHEDNHNNNNNNNNEYEEHAGDAGAADADASMEIHPLSDISPQISPLHSPHMVEGESNGNAAFVHDDTDHHSESSNHTEGEIHVHTESPNLSVSSSPSLTASAPTSPLPSIPKPKPAEPEKLKLPPIVEQCEHMTYPPFSDSFHPYIDENFPCPIQDFYRMIISGNFWSEVNDSLGYTEATLTPWLTKNTSAGSPCCLFRQLNFKMELNAKIGPKNTRVQQAQRCRLKNSKELVLETSSVSLDVPYADSFTTDNLLIAKSINDGASCNIKIACRVNFSKATWGLGGFIEKSAVQGSKDFFAHWIVSVRHKIDKEYTKVKAAATPPTTPPPKVPANPQKQPAHRNAPSSPSPLSHSSPAYSSNSHPSPQHPSPQLHGPSHPHKQAPSKIASHAPPNPSAFTPVSVAPKKFWPNLQHQISQLPMPVVALSFVVLLIIAIGLPYVLYLHSRVAFAESQIIDFNSAAERVDNKIAFMQLYINYLKEHPTSPPPPTPSTPRDDLKAEIAGLAHLLELANALEMRMQNWKHRLDAADGSLRNTQDVVGELRDEMGRVLTNSSDRMAKEKIEREGGWVYFIVAIIGSFGVIGASMYYFRGSLPFNLKF